MDVFKLIYLIPLIPLAGFIINGLLRNHLPKSVSSAIGSVAVLISFGLSLMIFNQAIAPGFVKQSVSYFDFLNVGKYQVEFGFTIDQLTSVFLLIITGIGFLIHVYSASYMHEQSAGTFAKFYAFLNLFVFSMLMLVMGSNFLMMFIGWEGVGLCSYLLIGFWYKNQENSKAANKAFIMNRIGDVGFLLAMFWMLVEYGTLSYAPLFDGESALILSQTPNSVFLIGVTLLLLLGATGKSAQIPLYTWLPDAMAGPTPVSALIHAATMVTAGIYMIARSSVMFALTPFTMVIIAIVGLATALLGALIALRQNDIKKILAYSTVSQLGFMFLALGVGAFTAGVFHVMTHAFFKALLFLGAGSVIHALAGEQDVLQMGGLAKKLKITFITFLIGTIAIAGIPPFSGFFSKDEILIAAWNSHPVYYIVGIIGSLLTAIYMFRLLALTFSNSYRGTMEPTQIKESPSAMTLPLIILAILSLTGGWVGIPEMIAPNANHLHEFLNPVFAKAESLMPAAAISHSTEWILAGISAAVALIASIAAWMYFKKGTSAPATNAFTRAMENKFYVDEIYKATIIRPLEKLSVFFEKVIDRKLIDGLVNGVGRGVLYGSRQFRWLQSGQVASYLLLMVVGLIAFFVIQMFLNL